MCNGSLDLQQDRAVRMTVTPASANTVDRRDNRAIRSAKGIRLCRTSGTDASADRPLAPGCRAQSRGRGARDRVRARYGTNLAPLVDTMSLLPLLLKTPVRSMLQLFATV